MGRRWMVIGFLAFAGLLLSLIPSSAKPSAPSDTSISIFPVTTGVSRLSTTPFMKVLIIGTHANPSMTVALTTAKDIFRRGGVTIIEDAIQRSLPQPQGPQQRDRQDFDVALRTMAKGTGADHVIVLEITDTLVLDKTGPTKNSYLHDERVSVRGVGVDSGSVVLEGTARWSQPIERAGEHIRELTAYAIARAICLPDKWEEASASNNGRGKCRR